MKKLVKVLLITCAVFAIGIYTIKTTDVEKKADAEVSVGTASVEDPGGGGRP